MRSRKVPTLMPIEQATEIVELLWVIMTMASIRTGAAVANAMRSKT